MLSRIVQVLREHQHDVLTYFPSSAQIRTCVDKLRAFFTGIYSRTSRSQLRKTFINGRPDIVHIQNLFPLISPSILPEACAKDLPVVMRCANYRLICPNGLLLSDGELCERCLGGREWHCIFHNCESTLPKSIGYAIRSYVARRFRLFLDNVALYICQTDFQRSKLASGGVPLRRLEVVPNMASPIPEHAHTGGQFIAYVGRMSPEKGIPTFVEAARSISRISFRAAGSLARMEHLVQLAPSNLTFTGYLARMGLDSFYNECCILVCPSVCYEGFPSVIIDAMVRGKPVICSRIGGLPEIVDHGVTGLLFEPGNAEDLVDKIRYLWERPNLCRQMGMAGREKALREYSPEKYYDRLMAVYARAIKLGPPRTSHVTYQSSHEGTPFMALEDG